MLSIFVSLLQLGGMQLTLAVSAVARNKVLALRLGADGFGEFNQVTLIASVLSTVAGLGLALSLNRNVAAAQDHGERQRMLAQANAVNLTLSSALLIPAIALLTFRPDLLRFLALEPTPQVRLAVLLVLLYVPLEVAVQHRLAFLTALLDIQGMTQGRSLAIIIATIIAIPLIWFLGLTGAALQLMVLSALLLVLLNRRCTTLGYAAHTVAWSAGTFRHLVVIGSASLVTGFAQDFGALLTRTNLMNIHGPVENGIYQAALSVAYQVRAVVLGGVGSYMTAKISQSPSRDQVNKTADSLLRVVLPLAVTLFAALGLFSRLAINVLYSAEFDAARLILPPLIATEYLNVMLWVAGTPILAFHHIRSWTILTLIEMTMRTGFSIALLIHFGGAGVAYGYLTATALHLTFTITYSVTRLGLRIPRRAWLHFAGGLILTVGMSVVGALSGYSTITYAAGLMVLAAYGLLAVQETVGLRRAWHALRHAVSERRPDG